MTLPEYAEAIYSRPGFKEAALRLQDRDNANLLMLIFALWASRYRTTDTQRDIRRAQDRVSAWDRDVVSPLRKVRRYLKSARSPASLYEQALDVEIAAERALLAELGKLFPAQEEGEADGKNACEDNVRGYLTVAGLMLSTEGEKDLAALIAHSDNDQGTIR